METRSGDPHPDGPVSASPSRLCCNAGDAGHISSSRAQEPVGPSSGIQGCPQSALEAPVLPLGHCFGKSKTEPSFPQSAGAQSMQKAKLFPTWL